MTQVDTLPAELREKGLFCCWRYEDREGKPNKVPYNPRTGGRAQSTNPATFAPLAVAQAARGYDGLGVGVFNGLGAIDIDHCIGAGGEISNMAADIMHTMEAYTEYSPSGTGLRILFKASGFQYDKARYYINNQKAGVEVYIAGCTNKFATVTGNAITPGWGLEERRERLQAVLEKYMVRPVRPTPLTTPSGPVSLEEAELVDRASQGKGGAAFAALWGGDTTGYASPSEADIALCNALAWWTNRDPEQVDRLFRQSGLMRPKWDRPQSGSTYGRLTVENAVATCQGGYDPEEYRRTAPARAFGGKALDWSASIGESPFAPFEPFAPPDTSRLPPFPVECLPPVLRDMAAATAENLQVAVDMPALEALAVAALCLQGKFIINPKPGWVEALSLYVSIVALPSERKSPSIKVITRPVYAFVKEENARRRPCIDEYNMKHDILVKRIKGLTEAASKPAKPGKAVSTTDIVELQWELADLEKEPVRPLRLLADDITPEALVSLMADNGGRMAIVSSEGGIFDIAAGRYSDKLNLDIFLKAYTGDYIQIDRKGRPSEDIEHPALTMLLTIQPAVLEAVMGNHEFSGRGFLARFIYALPVSAVGRRRFETAPIPRNVEEDFRRLIYTLLSIPEEEEAHTIKLSPEAYGESRRFFDALEPRLVDDLEEINGWAGKYHGQVMRTAGILHCCTHGGASAEQAVSLETMKNAEAIGSYYLAHAQAAFQVMGLSDGPEVKDAKYILKRLRGKPEISKRDLFQLCNGRFRSVEDMEPGMKALAERGYIAVETVKTGGRPTEKIRINPELQKVQ